MKEKRTAGNYEVTTAFEIGTKEIIIGEDKSAASDERFLIANCESNGIFERFVDALVSDDYAEIAKIFAERVKNEAEKVIDEKSKICVDMTPITEEGCRVLKAKDGIKNKVVVIRADVFKPEYQISIKQLQLCTGGFGAEPNSRGSACFCTNIYSGVESRFERSDILGVIDKDDLPSWAQERLNEIQKAIAEKRSKNDSK